MANPDNTVHVRKTGPGMPLHMRSAGTTTAKWVIAALVVILLFWGIYMFLKHENRSTKHNPEQSSLQLVDPVLYAA
jgi:putative Mn2+ efflux pump MntP